MLVFGAVGFFLKAYAYNVVPIVLGLILGPIAEEGLSLLHRVENREKERKIEILRGSGTNVIMDKKHMKSKFRCLDQMPEFWFAPYY